MGVFGFKKASDLALEARWEKQANHLPLTDGVWRYSRQMRRGDPAQGWKIHIAATVLSASDVFARSAPILIERDALFKIPARLSLLSEINSGRAGFSQIGKFITIYTRSDADAVGLARDLHAATRGLPAPEIPFDARYRRHGLVYYRYGGYANGGKGTPAQIVDYAGRAHLDRREPMRAIPSWRNDPFKNRRSNQAKLSGPFGVDFLVFKAFTQRGKGSVFEALELSTFPARLVVIKQGKRHGDTDWNGEDGYARIRREGRVLRALRRAGIPVPKIFREFNYDGNRYLILEKICGRPLLPRMRQQPAKPSWRRALGILDKLETELSKLHAAGWVWRDCKPAHIFISRKKICLIDFEGACRASDTRALPWGSFPYVPPCYRKESAARRAGTLEDDYALGVIAFQFLSGQLPTESTRLRGGIYKRTCCPAELRDRIESLLGY